MRRFLFSIPVKTLLVCAASFLLAIFILTVLASLLVYRGKQRLVEQAVTLAEDHGRNVAEQLSGLFAADIEGGIKNLEANPRAHSIMEILLRQNDVIIMAALVDETGNMIIHHQRDTYSSGTLAVRPGDQFAAVMPGPAEGNHYDLIMKSNTDRMREVRLPVMRDGREMGQLRFGISENIIMSRIASSGRMITTSMLVLLGTVSVILLLTYIILLRIFTSHVAVVRERDRLDKLAAIGTLASGLAHEIRNPLNAMNVNIDVVREEIEDPRGDSAQRASQILGNLKTEIGQLNQTLSSFMTFAIPGRIEKQAADLVTLIRETLEFHAAEMEMKQVRVICDFPVSCPVEADSSSIKRLFMNLFLNAVQAMEGAPERILSVRIHPEGRFWHTEVTDTGPGFDKKDPEECFEVFFTTKSTGTGFGLPIARQVAQAHEGFLWAENAGPRGARFHVTIPRA
ncbi:MAG TPA: ATP-binding protein [Candidatus Sumerlaeota bacterium]|nr:ATP-binding protein [Candidatus Sumerlaeota bacterium]